MNHAYYQKRSAYVCFIASYLESNDTFLELAETKSLSVIYMKGDLKKPILSFKPKYSKFKDLTIRLLFNVSFIYYLYIFYVYVTILFFLDNITINISIIFFYQFIVFICRIFLKYRYHPPHLNSADYYLIKII